VIVYVVPDPGVTEYEPVVPDPVIAPGLIAHERPEVAQFTEATLIVAVVGAGVHVRVYVYVVPTSSSNQTTRVLPPDP
jgi:hypothetical protein